MTPRFTWLARPDLASLLAALDGDGEEARVVGGAVRDHLLGEAVTEWDIATTATPAIVTARACAKGWKVAPTGIDHGTVTVVVDGHPFEVTTLREDVETDGRHAVVRFGRDFSIDAQRRDFTINALSVSPDGALFDYTGGIEDLAARRVRFIGDADTRIAEDALRILRFFRFFARYGAGEPDAAGMAAATRGRAGLVRLSRERVRAELFALLLARRAVAALDAMVGGGLFEALLQSPPRLARLARLIEHREDHPDVLRRLAALACFVSEDAERLAPALRLSRAEATRLETMASASEALRAPPDAAAIRRLVYRLGSDGAGDALRLAAASDDAPGWDAAIADAQAIARPVLPWRGADLMARGVAPGPSLGAMLARLELNWIKADFPHDSNTLSALLDSALLESKGEPAQDDSLSEP